MKTILLLAILAGDPLFGTEPTMVLRLHLGNDARSRIIVHEWTVDDSWFIAERIRIQRLVQVRFTNQATREPRYQIGHGDREPFPAGAFAASGSAIKTIRSLVEVDRWHRDFHKPNYEVNYKTGEVTAVESTDKPEVFPPEAK